MWDGWCAHIRWSPRNFRFLKCERSLDGDSFFFYSPTWFSMALTSSWRFSSPRTEKPWFSSSFGNDKSSLQYFFFIYVFSGPINHLHFSQGFFISPSSFFLFFLFIFLNFTSRISFLKSSIVLFWRFFCYPSFQLNNYFNLLSIKLGNAMQ